MEQRAESGERRARARGREQSGKVGGQMEKYSSISSIIERMKKQMLTDSTLKRRVDMVAERVSKSQERT